MIHHLIKNKSFTNILDKFNRKINKKLGVFLINNITFIFKSFMIS